MEILFELGLTDYDIKNMLELYPDLIELTDKEIKDKISILNYIGCNKRHIKNIIISNPYYFNRLNNDILKLLNYLKIIGVTNIYLLLDSNPYLLNKDIYEIKEYIDNQINKGIVLKDIIDEFESNPYIIDQI